MKTYGTLRFKDGGWEIEAEPHILMRLKNVFPRINQVKFQTISLSNTEDTCRDLEWFLKRYSLAVDPISMKLLKRGSARLKERILRLEDLIGGKTTPREFKLALPLRDYQKLGAELALQKKALLIGDDVGTGKTAQAIGILTELTARPALVVTLSGTMPRQWEAEIKRFLPEAVVHVLKKAKPYALPQVNGRGPDILIANYQKLSGWADVLAAYVRGVIYDEIQELRRESSAKYAAAKIVSSKASYRIGLSATPVMNYGGEFYNIMDVIMPGALGHRAEFKREWCSCYQGNKILIDDPKAFGTYLREQFLMIRRTRAEVGRELPPLQKITQIVDSDAKPLEDVRSAATELAKIILSSGELKKGDRMRAAEELSWKLRHATGVAKAPHVADFVRLLIDSGERVLLYAWHRVVYDILQDRLKDFKPVMYTGEESTPQKIAAKAAFVNGETPLMMMSLRAGAGVDGLQHVCKTVVFAELDWSPGQHEQAIGRVFRDGQKDPVCAYFMVAETGSDPIVAETLGIKREQVEGIRNPKRDIVEGLQTDTDRAASLARAYLKKLGIKAPAAVPQPTASGVGRI